jgi:CHAT domain-containing protein
VLKTSNPDNSAAAREELLQKLPRLRRKSSQAKFLIQHPELLSSETVTWLADSARDQAKVDTTRAISLAELAMAVAGKLREKSARGRALRAMGNALYVSGQNKAAVGYHAKAHTMFVAARDRTEVARTLSASIQPLILIGQYDRAFRNAKQARKIFTAQQDKWRLARLDLNTGNIFYRQDRFAEALTWYQRAHRYFLANADKDPEAMGVALHNIAVCLLRVNDLRRGLATHREARAFAEKHNMPALVGQADYNIAGLHYMRGEYGRAINLLLATREASKRNNDPYHVALCNLDLSEIYLELNLSGPAEEMAQEASRGFHKLGMGYEAGKSLVNLALAMARQEEADRALKMLAQARQQFVREKNLAWPFWTDFYRAVILMKLGQYREARQVYFAANQFFRSGRIPTNLILGRLFLAQLYFHTGRLELATKACSTALAILKKVHLPALACQTHQLLARTYMSQGNKRKAYRSYQEARRLLEATRGGLRKEELKISFMEGKLEIYEGLVQICLDSGEHTPEEAFEYIEQSKSRSLQDMVSGSDSASTEASESQRKAIDLRAEINWYTHQHAQEQLSTSKASAQRLAELQQEIHKRENALLRLTREIPSFEAESAGLASSKAATLEEIRDSLPADSTLVEYFQIEDRLLAAVLTRDTLQIAPVTDVLRVVPLLEKLEFQLGKLRLGPEYVRTFGDSLLKTTQRHLKELHDELVAPLESHLKGQHLVIVPHGVLHRLPFQALFDGSRYLIDKFMISYAPSATILSLCHRRAVNEQGPSLVMGVPDAVAPLIGDEATAVASVIPRAELFLGEQATTAVLKEKGPHCRLIHIATHGFFRQDSPMFSGIRLGDAMLSLYDLYRLKLPAELVTLSGCATGVSTVAGGDELLGLVRGLIYAGARATLLTLWDVNDRSTLEFMTTFYRHLSTGGKACALQKAVWDLRQRYPHPYFWAPFSLVGNLSA